MHTVSTLLYQPIYVYTRSLGLAGNGESLLLSPSTSALPLKVQSMEGEVEAGSIFVSIASYRDSECQHTLMNLFKTAMRPHRVYVGLVWQYCQEEDADCFRQALPPQWAKQVCLSECLSVA